MFNVTVEMYHYVLLRKILKS